ncbi:unnamed protein product [Ectocarpus sp. CCAP 1310/34]|nr:unnamed protein product [Ectocarpus sp. CCAP 1310/34]
MEADRDDMRQSLVAGTTQSSDNISNGLVRRASDSGSTGVPGGGAGFVVPASMGKEYMRKLATRNLVITLTCTSCLLMLYGYDFGITAWSVLMIKTKGAEDVSDIYTYLSTHGEALGILVACAPIGGFIEGLIGTKIASKRGGRKAEIRLVNLLCIFGATLEGMAGMTTWDNLNVVLLFAFGRLIFGLGLGLSLRCGPMYLRETVREPFRNAATVSVKLSMVVGVIISYVLGGVLSGNPTIAYFGVWILAGTSLACLQLMPESPMYMLLHEEQFHRGQILDALRFTSPAATEADLISLQEEILTEVLAYTPGHPSFAGGVHGISGDASCDGAPAVPTARAETGTATTTPTAAARGAFSGNGVGEGTGDATSSPTTGGEEGDAGYDPLDNSEKRGAVAMSVKNLPSLTKARGMRAALVLTAGLMVFEQASGMAAILYYGGVFLADIAVISVDWGLAILGALQLAMAVAVMYALNPIGRKPLLYYGLAGLMASSLMLMIGGFLGMADEGRWWALIGLYAFTASYSTSLGALVWVLVSEVFPTCHRAQAISIVGMSHFGTSAIVVILLPLVQDIGGYAAMFTCFFVVSILANIFAHRYMVETRGLTLVEIQNALTLKAAGLTAPPETMESASV